MTQTTVRAPGQEAAPNKVTRSRFSNLDRVKRSLTAIAFVVLFAAYGGWLGGGFYKTDARMLDIHQNAPILILALSVMVTLIAGQFDLSVGSMTTLIAFLTVGLRIRQDYPFWLVLLVCLGIGTLGGLINGLLVVKLRVNTFIATLATGGVMDGFATVYGRGSSISSSDTSARAKMPAWFTGPGSFGAYSKSIPSAIVWVVFVLAALYLAFKVVEKLRSTQQTTAMTAANVVGGVVAIVAIMLIAKALANSVSWSIAILFLLGFLVWVLIERTSFGRYLRAIGQNPAAARLAGIKTERDTIIAFMIGGFLASIAGIFVAANLGSAQPGLGAGFLLPAFAATFLSTVLLSSGRFTVWGTIGGGIILVYIAQGLIIGGVNFTWTSVVNGVVLAVAVAISTVFKRT
jgi:ribose/xylose/arabinose/galactoside ABC-type transport system permease subunit